MVFYIIFNILIYAFYLLSWNSVAVNAAVVYKGPKSVLEGESFTISCNAPLFSYIKWRLNETRSSYLDGLFTEFRSNNEYISKLTVTQASPSHTGLYVCSSDKDDFGHSITVIADGKYVLNVTHSGTPCKGVTETSRQKCAIGRPFEEFSLECLKNQNLGDHSLNWYFSKDNITTKQRVRSTETIEVSGSRLRFISLNATHNGIYQCRAEKENPPLTAAEIFVNLYVTPYVSGARKDITVIEHQIMNLTCPVTTAVPTQIVWIIDTPAYTNRIFLRNGSRVGFENNTGTITSYSLLLNVSFPDRGHYTCYAESDYGNSAKNSTYFVRIKSKFAAAIPLIGICTEFTLLCAIILIYEKRTDATDLEESDTDQGPETKSTSDHSQDIRFRK